MQSFLQIHWLRYSGHLRALFNNWPMQMTPAFTFRIITLKSDAGRQQRFTTSLLLSAIVQYMYSTV